MIYYRNRKKRTWRMTPLPAVIGAEIVWDDARIWNDLEIWDG